MSKKHGTKSGCFKCGDLGHFVADCPKRNHYYLKGGGGGSGSNDAGGYTKPNDYKYQQSKGSPAKHFRKVARDYRKKNKRHEKAFLVEVEDRIFTHLAARSESSSSSSSSSDEEVVIKKKGGKKNGGGPAGLYFMAHGHKRRS